MVLKVHEIESIHFRVLRLLDANPAMQQRELAEELGVSLGKTNYCLKALLDKGMLKMRNFQSSKRKLDEYAVLKAEIESLKQEQSVISATDALSTK